MLRRVTLLAISWVAGASALAGCFPSLEPYGACADGACGGATGTSGVGAGTSGTTSTASAASTASTASTTSTASTASGEGGTGTGGGGASATSTTSSTGGGGGNAPDPCAPPTEASSQIGSLVEGESQGVAYAFCMDQLEVTHLEYRQFYDDVMGGAFDLASALADVPQCEWKATTAEALVPDFNDMSSGDWNNTDYPDHPIVGIDFCDASAHCAWAGKRLCGGVNGAPITFQSQQPKNEWYLACSHDGQRLYSYNGDGEFDEPASACINGQPDATSCPAYDPERCASGGVCNGWRGLWNAEESVDCTAATPGILNLAGNVYEWVDACSPSATPSGWICEQRGGACGGSAEGGFYTSCAWSQTASASDVAARGNYYGFRCCWDPPEG